MQFLFYVFVSLLINLILYFIIMMVYILHYFFKTLNTNLKETIIKLELNFTEKQFQRLNRIFYLHSKCQKLVDLFSSAFGIQCVGSFLYLIGVGTCQLFYLYTVYYEAKFDEPNSFYNLLFVWSNALWLMPITLLHCLLGYQCAKTVEESEKINFLTNVELNSKMQLFQDKVDF